MDTLSSYEFAIRIDALLGELKTKYPYQLNEKATFTKHQITLYQSNYCHTETEQYVEQPAVTGGASTDIVFIDF